MTKDRAIQVLREMKNLTYVATDSRCSALDMAIKSMQTEAEWIPCSERLPKEDGYYLCCNKGYLPFVAHYYGGQWHDFDWTTPHIDAWMPLPKPYREENEE